MRRLTVVLLLAFALTAVGCAFKMGNAQLDLLEGLSHPANTVEKTEKVTPNEKK